MAGFDFWERPTDPTSGLIQMGARSYVPSFGSFASEDPVLGHLGIGVSVNRYPYVRDNPLNRYDLNGRDACVPTPFGGACVGEAAEDVATNAEQAVHAGAELITHPGRSATRAVEYWAESESPVSNVFGPLATLGDMGLNPDRIGYHLEKVSPAQMAATGLAAGATVGFGGLTYIASDPCYTAVAPLEAAHACSVIAGTGMTITGIAGTVTIETARR